MPFNPFSALPWKWIGLAVAALGAIAAIIFGINHMLARAKQAGRDEVRAEWNAEKAGRAQASAELTAALGESFNHLDRTLQKTVSLAAEQGQTIRTRVSQELKDDPRYSSAECALSDSVREAVNAARRLSADPAAAAINIRSLSLSSGADGRLVVDTGER